MSAFPLTQTPLILPACNTWLDASDTSTNNITSSGGFVSVLKNKSVTQNNCTQLSGANQPRTGIQTQNGLNVISFSAASTQFMNFSANTPVNVPFTVFLVGQSNSGANVQNFMGRQTSSIPGQWTLRRETNGGVFNTFGYGTAGSSQAANASNNNANIHAVTLGDNVAITYRVNNVLSGTPSVPRTGYDNAVATRLALGAPNNSPISNTLDGWIGEVIIYSTILTSDQISFIQRYLSNKWGIAIS